MKFNFDKQKLIVISLGGSIFYPNELDVAYLKEFANEIRQYVSEGYRFIIITGGGRLCRVYQEAARTVGKPTDADLDWIGIASTRLNAQLLRSILTDIAHPEVIEDPSHPPAVTKPVVIGSGWIPGRSSDHDSAMLAIHYGGEAVINLSTADFVYTADPKKDPSAKKLFDVTWKEYMGYIPNDWKPGMSAPFDPTAAKHAAEHNLTVCMANGRDLVNLRNLIEGREAQGTMIHS